MKLSIISSIILLSLMLIGCRAKKEIDWAAECATRYPVTETFIRGKDYYHTDTLKGDCILVNCDPIILKAKCPPALTITKTNLRVDTVVKENQAKISALENKIKGKEHELQTERTKRSKAEEQAQKSNRQRNYCIGLVLVGGLIAGRKQLARLLKIVLA